MSDNETAVLTDDMMSSLLGTTAVQESTTMTTISTTTDAPMMTRTTTDAPMMTMTTAPAATTTRTDAPMMSMMTETPSVGVTTTATVMDMTTTTDAPTAMMSMDSYPNSTSTLKTPAPTPYNANPYVVGETPFEFYFDIALGVAFLVTALVAARRMRHSRRGGGGGSSSSSGGGGGGAGGGSAETTVVTAFYSLILLTSLLRSLWFLIPSWVWHPSYVPVAVYAWDEDHPSWVGSALGNLTVTAGSLALFSIFILILVYWADILKKYFHPGSRRSLPMATFLSLVCVLIVVELINLGLFLAGFYTTEGMILFNSILLAIVSMICVCEITIFSHRFRTVLKTLGAINQVSTDSQVRRIVWITVTGNLFFFTRAFLETLFAVLLIVYWYQHGTVARVFRHFWWDIYVGITYWSEIIILGLMLYILQSRFTSAAAGTATAARPTGGKDGYSRVPDAAAASGGTVV